MKLGVWDVSVLSRGLTAKKFAEWQAYAQVEPFDELRGDYRAAAICQMIFNMAVDPKSRLPMNKFLLQWEAEETKSVDPKKKAAQQWKMLELLALAHSVPAKE